MSCNGTSRRAWRTGNFRIKLDAQLSKGIMSIGAVKAVEIGDGFLAAASNGSTNNDAFAVQDGQMIKEPTIPAGFWAVSATAPS